MTNPNHQHYITLLRHGESVGNADGYHQGQVDFPLTEKGRAQARALAAYWQVHNPAFDTVVASPQSRARETAEIITSALSLSIEFGEIWMERDNGLLGGLHHTEAQEKYPQPDFIPLYDPIGRTGESQWELYLRGGKAVQSLLHRPPARYLVVSHGAILNMVVRAILGIMPQPNYSTPRFRFPNTAFATFTFNPNSHLWVVHGINQRPHWGEEEHQP
ncbi:MAG: histidine phosphatase family protein [Anaerolineae bacterium]|nr:histidine phosphatase family protein [Anaerolineae bacterium]